MNSCNSNQIMALDASRNFLQYPDASVCGIATCFYGEDCQMMQVTLGDKQIRASANPLRTWKRRRAEWCEIGNTQTPPGTSTATIDFYQLCGAGIPLPYRLENCEWGVVINYGTCYGAGDIVGGWSAYTERARMRTTSMNGGRRTSYDGAGDPLTFSITADVLGHDIYGPMQFSAIPLSDQCTPASLRSNSAAFGCNVGCGNSNCGCQESCDDGTQAIYFGLSCQGGANNLVSFTTNGGQSVKTLVLPAPATSGGIATTYPQVATCGGVLYALAYENPVSLFGIRLDAHGNPTGTWTELAVLGTGTPGSLVCDGDHLHILVTGPNSYYYTLDFNNDPADGPRETFPDATMTTMAVCGKKVLVGGENGALEISLDGGRTWSPHPVPVALTGDIASVAFNGIYTFITSSAGQVFVTNDGGFIWRQINIPGASSGGAIEMTFGNNGGWALGNGAPFNSWLGGLNGSEWLNTAPRITNWPMSYTASGIAVPTCATARLNGNTALVTAVDNAGQTVALLGRAIESGC